MVTESALALLTLILIKPLLITGVIILGLLLLSKKSAALQHFWLATGMIALLILPLLVSLLPEIQWQILPTGHPSSTFFLWVYRLLDSLSQPGVLMTVAAIYFLGVFWLLFYLGLGILALAIQTRHARPCEDPEILQLVDVLSCEMGIARRVAVVTSRDLASPQMWGMVNPVIMLPVNASTWTSERKISVLLHELGHVARYDWATTIIVKICCALFWFLPPVWWLAERLFHYAEIACDDFIYRLRTHYQWRSKKEVAYAENLLAMAQAEKKPIDNIDPVLSMAGHSPIFYRIEAVLDHQRQRENATPEARQYWVLILLMMLLPLASLQLIPIQQTLIAQVLNIRLPESGKDSAITPAEVMSPQIHRLDAETLRKLKQQLIPVDMPHLPLEKMTVTAAPHDVIDVQPGQIELSSPLSWPEPSIRIQGYMPLEMVIPIYPRNALQNGTEGEVIVEFSIAEDGSIFTPRILSAVPRNVFDKTVLAALQRSRYTPQIINGVPVIIEGVIETFTFQIEQPSLADKRRR